MTNAQIDNQRDTLITQFASTAGTFLNLIDESTTSKRYAPLQLHFHAPSEHTFNGKHYDLELHIVNANADRSDLSVISISFDVQDGGSNWNWFISQVLNNATNIDAPNRFTTSNLEV